MEVICIDDDFGDYGPPYPRIGEIDTVIEEETYRGIGFYILERFGPGHSFDKDNFAPLSTIDETEMIRNYETAKA